jgi:hypothetical protein
MPAGLHAMYNMWQCGQGLSLCCEQWQAPHPAIQWLYGIQNTKIGVVHNLQPKSL